MNIFLNGTADILYRVNLAFNSDAFSHQVLGYHIYCQVVDCHEDRPKGCNESEVFKYTTADASASIEIKGLRKYTNYSCTTQVFNEIGAGNISSPIYIMTAEDSKLKNAFF